MTLWNAIRKGGGLIRYNVRRLGSDSRWPCLALDKFSRTQYMGRTLLIRSFNTKPDQIIESRSFGDKERLSDAHERSPNGQGHPVNDFKSRIIAKSREIRNSHPQLDPGFGNHLNHKTKSRLRKYLPIISSVILVWLTISYVYNKQIKEFVARKIGNYLTKNSRFTVVFEEASIFPGWNRLYFKKCFISRRPKLVKKFEKGSQQAAIDHAVKERELESIGSQEEEEEVLDDGNYTQYDLTINEINVSLSFAKWLNSKGILKDVELKGVRGLIDRTHVHWDPADDPRNYLNVPSPSDFNMETFKIEDFLVTLYQPGNFRPFNISIFNCNLSRLRQNWLLVDFLNANNINGSYDGSLFTINKIHDPKKDEFFTRCRIDGLNVDHLNAGVDGPFGWIVKGTVDMLGDIKIPSNNYKFEDFFKIIRDDIARKIRGGTSSSNTEDYAREYKSYYNDDDKFFLNLRLQLNNVKAKIPLFTNELSYINYALMRPIIGYINSRQTYVAINCLVIKSMKDFNGSWTVYDSLLMDDISNKVYEEFGNYVIDEEQKSKRLKKIGFWALQIMLQVFLFGVSSIG